MKKTSALMLVFDMAIVLCFAGSGIRLIMKVVDHDSWSSMGLDLQIMVICGAILYLFRTRHQQRQ